MEGLLKCGRWKGFARLKRELVLAFITLNLSTTLFMSSGAVCGASIDSDIIHLQYDGRPKCDVFGC